MEKYKKIARTFVYSYTVILVTLLIEFFYLLFTDGTINMLLLLPILLGTMVFLILNSILKPGMEEKTEQEK